MSSYNSLKGNIPQYPQYQIPSRNPTSNYSTSDRYGGIPFSQASTIANSVKSKGGLPCKKDKKHQSFDLIFICLEKECVHNLKPICAQCLHEEHSGHEVKLIKEIAEIANNFISSERRKKKISPYWEQLSDQYSQLYDQIESIITHLQSFQSTLKKSNDEFFSKLNSEKNEFWETVESASQKILNEKYASEEDLFQKIRLILKNVKIDDPTNPSYRYNILKEETVLLVMQNYKEIDSLVSQSKDFVTQMLSGNQIKESYQAAEFKITDGEDYMKITSLDLKNGVEQQCIVEFDDKEDDDKEDENDENFEDEEDDYDNDHLESYANKVNKLYLSSSDKKEKKYQQENLLNDSDEFDLIGEESQKQKKQETGENQITLKQGKELKSILTNNQPGRVPQLPKIGATRLPEKPSTQEIRMKYAAEFSSQFWGQQPQSQIQTQTTTTTTTTSQNYGQPSNPIRKKEQLTFDDLSSNNDYQYTTDFFSRFASNNDDLYKNSEQSLQSNHLSGNPLNQYSSLPRSNRPLPPPNNLSIQTFLNSYQKM